MRTLTLSNADARRIEDSLPGVYQVVPMRAKRGQTVKRGNKNYQDVVIVGATEDYAKVWNWPLSEGRDITDEDQKIGAKVALLGSKPARELFGDESPHWAGGVHFEHTVPGGGAVDAARFFRAAAVATLTTGSSFPCPRSCSGTIWIASISGRFGVKFYEPDYMDAHTENLRSLLRHQHKLAPEADDDFSILTADEILKFLSIFKGGLTIFLGCDRDHRHVGGRVCVGQSVFDLRE